jgi:hypothetical protein
LMAAAAILVMAGTAAVGAADPAPLARDSDAEVARIIADDLANRPDDPAALATLGAAVARSGATLRVGPARFEDSGVCEGYRTCERWRLDLASADRRWAGVRWSDGEFVGYRLVHVDSGFDTETGDRVWFAPGGAHAASAAASDSDSHGADDGLRVWALGGDAAILIRAVPTGLLPYPEIEGWRGPRCLEFSAGRPPAPRSRWWLVADRPEWRLSRRPTRACRTQN